MEAPLTPIAGRFNHGGDQVSDRLAIFADSGPIP